MNTKESDNRFISVITPKECVTMIISKVYREVGPNLQPREVTGEFNLQSDKETIHKAQELINLFSEVPLETIKTCLLTSEGQLAIAVLSNIVHPSNIPDLTPLKMLVDELQEKLSAVTYNKDYISREALMIELNDVLKAKSITPYRRQRINRALKRECLNCLGTGRAGTVISDEAGSKYSGTRRKLRIGVSQTDNPCPTCKGSGIKPELDKIK